MRIASAVGGIPEVVEHGETGLLVQIEAGSATDVEPPLNRNDSEV